MSNLIRWWRTRKVDRQHREYRRGYDWAAGVLLRANDFESASLEVDSYVLGSMDPGVFDDGALHACRDWHDKVERP